MNSRQPEEPGRIWAAFGLLLLFGGPLTIGLAVLFWSDGVFHPVGAIVVALYGVICTAVGVHLLAQDDEKARRRRERAGYGPF